MKAKMKKLVIAISLLVALGAQTKTIAQATINWKSVFQKSAYPLSDYVGFEEEALDSVNSMWYKTASIFGKVDIDPGTAKVFVSDDNIGNFADKAGTLNMGTPLVASYDMNTGKLLHYIKFKLFAGTDFVQVSKIETAVKTIDGGVVVSGVFSGKFSVLNKTFTSKYSNYSQPDIFILKFNKELTTVKGITLQSAVKTSSGYFPEINNMAIDKNGNIVLVVKPGEGKYDFNPALATAYTTTVSSDKVIAIYTKDLKYKTSFKIESNLNTVNIVSLSLDANSSIYISGTYRQKIFVNAIDFDPSIAIRNLPDPPLFKEYGFLIKYSSIGKFVWAKSFTRDNSFSSFKSVVTAGGLYVLSNMGSSTSVIDVDPSAGVKTYTGKGIVVAKYSNTSGKLLWSFIDSLARDLNDFDVDSKGNLYIASKRQVNTTETATFLSKYNSNGVKKWNNQIKKASTASNTIIDETSINVRKNEIYFSGEFVGKYYLFTNNTQPISNTGTTAPISFMCKYTLSGGALSPEDIDSGATDNKKVAQMNGEKGDTGSVIIYPNPAVNSINIGLSETIADLQVQVLNLSGQVVKELSVSNTLKAEINISDLQQGIYFLNINNGMEFIQKKIVKANE